MKITCKRFYDPNPYTVDFPDFYTYFIVDPNGKKPIEIEDAENVISDIIEKGTDGIPPYEPIGNWQDLLQEIFKNPTKKDSIPSCLYPNKWVCEVLHLLYGKDFMVSNINGKNPGEHATIFLETNMTSQAFSDIQCIYFNLFYDYEIHIFNDDNMEIDDFSVKLYNTENIQDFIKTNYPTCKNVIFLN